MDCWAKVRIRVLIRVGGQRIRWVLGVVGNLIVCCDLGIKKNGIAYKIGQKEITKG